MEIMCEAGLVIPEVTYESAEISEATQELQSMPPGQIKAKNCIKAKRSRAKRALFFDACRNALAAQSDEQKSELELKIDERKKSNYQKYLDRGLLSKNQTTSLPITLLILRIISFTSILLRFNKPVLVTSLAIKFGVNLPIPFMGPVCG